MKKQALKIVKSELDVIRYMIAEEFYKLAAGDVPGRFLNSGICDIATCHIEQVIISYLENMFRDAPDIRFYVESVVTVKVKKSRNPKLAWSGEVFDWSKRSDNESYPIEGSSFIFDEYSNKWSTKNPYSETRKELAMWLGDLYYNGDIALKAKIDNWADYFYIDLNAYKAKP